MMTLAALSSAVFFAGLACLELMDNADRLDSRPVLALPMASESKLESVGEEEPPQILVEALKRPLFSEGRRPFVPSTPKLPTVERPEATAAKPTLHRPDLRLLGVHLAPSGQFALLSNPVLPRGEWIRLGAEIDGWKLNRIDVDSIELSRSKEEFRLKLHVDKSPAHIGSSEQLP